MKRTPKRRMRLTRPTLALEYVDGVVRGRLLEIRADRDVRISFDWTPGELHWVYGQLKVVLRRMRGTLESLERTAGER